MKKNLDIGTPLLSFLRNGAFVGGAIGAMVGPLFGAALGTGIIALGGGGGGISMFVVVCIFGVGGIFVGAVFGAVFGACLVLGFCLLWVIWKLFSMTAMTALRKTRKR